MAVIRDATWALTAMLLWGSAAGVVAQEPAPPAKPPAAASTPAQPAAPVPAPTKSPTPESAAAPASGAAPVPASAPSAPPVVAPAPAAAPVPVTPVPSDGVPATDAAQAPAQVAPVAPVAGGPATPPPPSPSYGELAAQEEPEIQQGEWDPWAHGPSQQRHDGFFLRIALGVGFGGMSTNGHILSDIDDLDLSSGGMGMSIGIGGALTDNLILYGDIFQMTLFNPDVEVDGTDMGDADSLTTDIGIGDEARIAGLGIGLNYYFTPVNIYVGGSIGFGQAIFEDSRGDVDGSDLGLGIDLVVGKEWWVGNDWGLGFAGQVLILRTEDDTLGDIDGQAFNLLFSATYN